MGQIKQIGPDPRDPYQQRPAATVQPQTRRRPPQGDVELMTEKQILGFEPASRLEHDANLRRMEFSDPQPVRLFPCLWLPLLSLCNPLTSQVRHAFEWYLSGEKITSAHLGE